MHTLIFIDDRPCSKMRPCSFNKALLLRKDIIPILIRFEYQQHDEEYAKTTADYFIYTIQNDSLVSEEVAKFKLWCEEKALAPDSFCCMSEPKQVFGQNFARLLGLKALSSEASIALRHKPTMKEWVKSAGFRTAAYSEICTSSDVEIFAQKHGYPIIVKPVAGWGTLGTFKISSAQEISKVEAQLNVFPEMMVESFIPWREYECCALIQDGSVLDVYPSYMPLPPIRAANGEINANISYGFKKESFPVDLRKIVQGLLEQFSILNGYLHMEFFMDELSKKVVIGELALRYPGCEIAKNHGLALGFDIANITLNIYIGKRVSLKYTCSKCVGDLLLPYKPGKVTRISRSEELLGLPGVMECHLQIGVGDILPEEPQSSFNCSGWLFIEGESIEEVEGKMYNALAHFTLVTE